MAKETEHEAHVVTEVPGEEVDEHGLTVLRVSESDNPAPDPLHTGKFGTPFDPNAALRNKEGRPPGLQDSEAKNPAVWVESDPETARKAAADRHVQDAELNLERAKKTASAVRKGEPFQGTVK